MEKGLLHRKDYFIITAIEILNELGIQGLSTRELAKRQNVSEATLFRHYKSKNALLLAVLDFYSQFDHDIYMSARMRDLQPIEAIEYLVQSYAGYYQGYPEITSILHLYDVFSYEPELGDKIKSIYNERTHNILQLIIAAQEANVIKQDVDSNVLTSIIFGIIRESSLSCRLSNEGFALKDKISNALCLILNAFKT